MLTRREVDALERYLRWFNGFEDALLYMDYLDAEVFTDQEYSDTRIVLSELVDRHIEFQKKEDASCP